MSGMGGLAKPLGDWACVASHIRYIQASSKKFNNDFTVLMVQGLDTCT